MLYQLRTTSAENLRTIAEIGQGLEHRLYQARSATSLENLLEILQTKRYPLARLRRILIHVLLDIRKSDTKGLPPYGRILAFNDMGRQILRCSKDSRGIPFSHSLKELSKLNPAASRCASLDAKATDIFLFGDAGGWNGSNGLPPKDRAAETDGISGRRADCMRKNRSERGGFLFHWKWHKQYSCWERAAGK